LEDLLSDLWDKMEMGEVAALKIETKLVQITNNHHPMIRILKIHRKAETHSKEKERYLLLITKASQIIQEKITKNE
jgi:hypothetical protein